MVFQLKWCKRWDQASFSVVRRRLRQNSLCFTSQEDIVCRVGSSDSLDDPIIDEWQSVSVRWEAKMSWDWSVWRITYFKSESSRTTWKVSKAGLWYMKKKTCAGIRMELTISDGKPQFFLVMSNFALARARECRRAWLCDRSCPNLDAQMIDWEYVSDKN